MNPRRHSLLRKVLFLGIPWMIFLVLLEGTACFFQQPYLPKQLDSTLTMVEPNPTRVWQYKKKYSQQYSKEEFTFDIQTNSLGLRDEEIGDTKAELRILVIGDSFTFGWGVQQSQRYTEFLKGILQDGIKSTKVHVLNAGHWFYTFDQQLLLLKEMLPVYKPHLVLQGFYGPHVLNLGEHSWERDSSGSLVSVSYVRRYDNEIKVNPDGSLRLTNHLIEEPPLSSCFIREAVRRYYRWRQLRETPKTYISLLEVGNPIHERAWEMTRIIIKETVEYLRSKDVPYIAFGIPWDVQVNELEWSSWMHEAVLDREIDRELPTQRIGNAVRESKARWVNLLPYFRKQYVQDLYFKKDPHWTKKGHRLAAEVLAPVVMAQLDAVSK